MNLGQAALLVAGAEVGHGESTKNNHGFHINRYRRGTVPIASGAWCATFICYCLEEGWMGMRKRLKQFPIRRTNSANKLATRLELYGALVKFDAMQPGDILLFDRSGGKHINIVLETQHCCNGKLTSYTTIDGNKGAFPSLVKEIEHGLYPKPLKVVRLP